MPGAALIHHLTGDAPRTAAVVCGDPAASRASFDLALVTCPACRRHCTCAPGVPLCPSCRTYNAAHRGRPTRTPPLRTEQQFQEALRQHAVAAGWLYFHVYNSRRSPSGWVDTVLCKDSALILAELKMPGKMPTPQQQMWLDALGQVTQVRTRLWRPEDWGDIEEMLQ